MISESITATEQFLALLQKQIDSSYDTGKLIEALQALTDPLSEAELQGVADALALFAEQLEQLERIEEPAEQRVLLVDFHKALDDFIHTPQPGIWQYLLASLSDSHWPEPLSAEDCEFLSELLEQDCQTLISTQITSAVEANAAEKSTVGNHLLPVSSPSLMTDWAESITSIIDAETDIGEALLHQLVEEASDQEYAGFGDLFALLAELWLSECANPQRARLLQQTVTLLHTPHTDQIESLLTLMSDPDWLAPLPEEDRLFLDDLLQQDLQQLCSVEIHKAESVESEIAPVGDEAETVAQPEAQTVEPLSDEETYIEVMAAPSFCDVDLHLLEQPGPELDPAVLTMLTDSLQQLQLQWQGHGSSESLLNHSLQQMELVIRAMNSQHLLGAVCVVQGLEKNISWLVKHPPQDLAQSSFQISGLLQDLISYLSDINDSHRQQKVLDQLEAFRLPIAPSAEQISYISGLLSLASLQSPESLARELAREEDTGLSVAEGIDPQLLDMLFNELPILSEQLSEQLQRMISDQSINAIREAQRAAHTIKGLANMAGISGIANLTHRLEDIFDVYSDAGQLPSAKLCDDLMAITDTLAMMCESVVDGGAAPASVLAILQLTMDWHYRLRTDGLTIGEPHKAPTQKEEQNPTLQEPSPAEIPNREQTQFRVPLTTLDSLMRLAGEGTTLNTQLNEEISQLRSYVRVGRERQRALQRIIFELEQQLNEQFTLQPGFEPESESFDPLEMDRYNEMHTSLSKLQEAAEDIREVEQQMDQHIRRTGELHIVQTGVQKETLERVLSTRLVDVKSVTPRLQRVLRQACRSTGKQAELVLEGESTRIDSHILNQLVDPLMHIIRNAVDHGLETPAERVAAGKPEQGVVKLRFWLENDLVRVSCGDDGAGIDLDRVQEVAVTRGLIDQSVVLSPRETERLILIPGFSTREEVSQLSGRGIGMDVVSQQVMQLQGGLDIRSERGRGTTFELSMPSSSMMIKTLLVRSGKQVYALASHGLEQSLISLDGSLQKTADGMVFEYAGEQFPAYGLEALLSEHGSPYEPGQVHPVLLVNLGQGEKVAVLVRELIAHRELAFKQMGDYLPNLPGIPGLTILANGDTAAVVDLPARIRFRSAGQQSLFNPVAVETDLEQPKLLVVDDSLSARTSLSTLLRDTGYDVSTAIDGLDAMNQIRKQRPDLVLTDLEMPRMGGMELTSMIRGRDGIGDIPVLMITSRTTQRHRSEAEAAGVSGFLTKPWTENNLLDNVQMLLQSGVHASDISLSESLITQ